MYQTTVKGFEGSKRVGLFRKVHAIGTQAVIDDAHPIQEEIREVNKLFLGWLQRHGKKCAEANFLFVAPTSQAEAIRDACRRLLSQDLGMSEVMENLKAWAVVLDPETGGERRYEVRPSKPAKDSDAKAAPDPRTVLPRLKHRAFIDAVVAAGPDVPPSGRPVVVPYVADLILTYVFDRGEIYQSLLPADIEAMGLDASSPRAIHELATENLVRLVSRVTWEPMGPLFQAVAGEDMESALLLVDAEWKALSERVEGQVVVGVPAPGLLIATGSEDKLGLSIAFDFVQEFHAQAGNKSLSRHLLIRDDSQWGWSVLPDERIPKSGPEPGTPLSGN